MPFPSGFSHDRLLLRRLPDLTKQNLPNKTLPIQTYQTKLTKPKFPKEQNHEPNWHIQARHVQACPELGTAQPQLVVNYRLKLKIKFS